MKLYTRTGDGGETGLFGAQRVPKHHPRVEAYGDVDETNSQIGLARALLPPELGELDERLAALQSALFDLGADLATPHGSPAEAHVRRVQPGDVAELEGWIDAYAEAAPPLSGFVLPGGHPAAAALQVARAVARRAERRVTALAGQEEINPEALRFLNRLSDLLFAMARWVNHRLGVEEPLWQKR
ncbi:cob(I)yrinic acid a,c-diamide adenosyltransferase [Oceanithermus sp.]|uniref:cob(I)yrinic acid a,c-diamide adenosyltransferase n=1 Tax=Oceanithermus sp. TaxID=2268145 RepID=UPI0025F57158|nr:cob(I)yrinic acid a,c-diamide adenosyltransferase [Oceanithermus sp.]